MTDGFGEAFLRANANLDYIAAEVADVIRDLVRAVASDQPSAAFYRPAERLLVVIELLSHAEDKISLYGILQTALQEFDALEGNSVEGTVTSVTLDAARRGMKYLVESSCSDNAARGRASQRRSEFMDAIKQIDEARRRTSKRRE